MTQNKPFIVRFATLDDVVQLREMPGENEVRTKFMHEAVLSPRQGIIVLEGSKGIEAYMKLRLTNYGVKIDDFRLSEDPEKDTQLIGTVESIPKEESVYLYIDPKNEHKTFFENLGYSEDLRTDRGMVKMIKRWSKITEDNEVEQEYQRKVKKVEQRYEVLKPRSVYGGEMLDKNLGELEKRIKEMRSVGKKSLKVSEEEEETFKCTVCEKEFSSERGMKIHRTKVHGKKK